MQQRSPTSATPRRPPRRPRRAAALAWAVAALVGAPAQAPADDDGPVAVVEAFHAALLDVMRQAEQLGVQERYRRLETPVKTAFHLPLMIQIASAGAWQQANEDQRHRLVAAFERMSVGNYAHRFDGWSGESFETVAETPGPRRTVLVETRIVRPDDDPVELTYVVKTVGDGYRIVDVLLARGVSELAVRRSEYQAVLAGEGVEGLIAALDRKTGDLLAGRAEE